MRTLDAGARQLIALARAVMADAQVIVLDEPTAVMEQPEVETLFRVVREQRELGRAGGGRGRDTPLAVVHLPD